MSRNYYDILGVPNGASITHIKDSYRILTRKTLITDAAYEVLTDPIRRRKYDLELIRVHKSRTSQSDEWGSEIWSGLRITKKAEPSDGAWVDLGAPRGMPEKPFVPTQQELYYIAGIEKLLQTGVPLENVADMILDFTPEQLLEVAGISLETETDARFLLRWITWLDDLVTWLKSLPKDLAQEVLNRFRAAAEGSFIYRYRFLAGGPRTKGAGPSFHSS
jgi:hypothetical protein